MAPHDVIGETWQFGAIVGLEIGVIPPSSPSTEAAIVPRRNGHIDWVGNRSVGSRGKSVDGETIVDIVIVPGNITGFRTG